MTNDSLMAFYYVIYNVYIDIIIVIIIIINYNKQTQQMLLLTQSPMVVS